MINKTKHEHPEPEETVYHCDMCTYVDVRMEMFGHIIVEHTIEEIIETMLESSRQRRKLEAVVKSLRT